MSRKGLATKPNKQSRTEIIFDEEGVSSEELSLKIALPASKSGKGDKVKSIYTATRYEFFFLHPDHPFNEQEKEQLKGLLFNANIVAKIPVNNDNDPYHNWETTRISKNNIFYVAPRRGTRSPWSSNTQAILEDIFPSLKDWVGGRLIERGYKYVIAGSVGENIDELKALACDKMIQEILSSKKLEEYFTDSRTNKDLRHVNMDDTDKVRIANREWGLAISEDELEYLRKVYRKLKRHATDAELMLFAQLNSEHCRHKIFNAYINMNDMAAKSLYSNGHKPSEYPEMLSAISKIDGGDTNSTMFDLIKKTSRKSPDGLVSAYTDNAAIFATAKVSAFNRYKGDSASEYQHRKQNRHLIFKAETHNHPTFVSPFPGAATGVGGEIRDEIACGIGGRTKAGFAGFSVSDLLLDSNNYNWEQDFGCPFGKATAQQIMLEAPLGSSHYANEFGRPTLAGYFRTLSCERNGVKYGYHKPIMLAGGWGEISDDQAIKPEEIDEGAHLVLMGEPALRIGVGGGSVSSLKSRVSKKSVKLDFASVQRDNAEMEKKCAEAIEACSRQGDKNPIVFIHDLGAGGLGNAVAELLKDGKCGGDVVLSKIPIYDYSMSPAEVWSNESQERFLLAVDPARLDDFDKICQRENAPYKVIGTTNKGGQLRLKRLRQEDNKDNKEDSQNTDAINLPLDTLFPKTPKKITATYIPVETKDFEPPNISEISEINEYAEKVLQLPAVASKGFLITIGDRFVGGLTAQEQMAGPWQVPINDYAATLADFSGFSGEAAAIGERTPLAILNPKAAVRMALAEVITNLAASGIEKLQDIKLCANWMAASNEDGQMANLYEGVRTLTEEMCQELGLAIPVGKDSLFMSASWDKQNVISPLSLIMSGLAPLTDVRLGVDPLLHTDTYKNIGGDNSLLHTDTYKNTSADNSLLHTDTYKNMLPALWLVSTRHGSNRLGGSALAQVMQQWEGETADIESPKDIANFFSFVSGAVHDKLLLAYHDVSDGGLWTTLSEMAFASNCGLSIDLTGMMKQQQNEYTALFGEEAGAVIQVAPENEGKVLERGRQHNLTLHKLGIPTNENKIKIIYAKRTLIDKKMSEMRSLWNKVSDNMRELRDDNPQCVKQEALLIKDFNYKGIQESINFDVAQKYNSIKPLSKSRPKVAILRTQGVNSNIETALAFHNAGFEAVDVHINDLNKGEVNQMKGYKGVVFCGGFTYGDALGAGAGWAASVLHNPKLKVSDSGSRFQRIIRKMNILYDPKLEEEFQQFFQRKDTFTLGICNGCQVLARLQEIIDGAGWNCRFQRNESRRFEARTVMVKICKSPSIFFTGMEGSVIPVASAHGEGKATFASSDAGEQVLSNEQAAIVYTDGVYTDGQGNDNPAYPLNPNGSAHGIAGMTSKDGRVTLLMPHPERTLRRVNQCWHDKSARAMQRKAEVATPWQAMFYNARLWVD